MHSDEAYEFKNDFLYFVIRQDKSSGKDVLIYCSGVNISLFSPITKGRHGIGSNPAMRGLQLVNLGVRERALSIGATPKALRGSCCAGISPTMDTWYTELLAIENAPGSFAGEMIHYCVMSLIEKIFKASMRELRLPDKLPHPQDLQAFLETQCRKYGKS